MEINTHTHSHSKEKQQIQCDVYDVLVNIIYSNLMTPFWAKNDGDTSQPYFLVGVAVAATLFLCELPWKCNVLVLQVKAVGLLFIVGWNPRSQIYVQWRD